MWYLDHWCRRRGCRGCNRTPKSFVLVKIREKSHKIRKKILWNPGKSLRTSKIPWKYEQKWRPTCFDLKITAPKLTQTAIFWRSHGARIYVKSFFLEVKYFSGKFGTILWFTYSFLWFIKTGEKAGQPSNFYQRPRGYKVSTRRCLFYSMLWLQ